MSMVDFIIEFVQYLLYKSKTGGLAMVKAKACATACLATIYDIMLLEYKKVFNCRAGHPCGMVLSYSTSKSF